jgi:hypothetical protein
MSISFKVENNTTAFADFITKHKGKSLTNCGIYFADSAN